MVEKRRPEGYVRENGRLRPWYTKKRRLADIPAKLPHANRLTASRRLVQAAAPKCPPRPHTKAQERHELDQTPDVGRTNVLLRAIVLVRAGHVVLRHAVLFEERSALRERYAFASITSSEPNLPYTTGVGEQSVHLDPRLDNAWSEADAGLPQD